MSAERAERFVVFTMRALAATFAVVGLLFIVTPNGVIGRMDDVGNWIGSFSTGPQSEEKLWLSLGFAYMVVITGIALLVSTDVGRYRPLLLVLAAGKAASFADAMELAAASVDSGAARAKAEALARFTTGSA